MLGGPGSGKGTQSARLVEEFGVTHLRWVLPAERHACRQDESGCRSCFFPAVTQRDSVGFAVLSTNSRLLVLVLLPAPCAARVTCCART